MSSNSLWPNFAQMAPPRGMLEMLYDAAGDIGVQTNGAIDFYIDPIGVGAGGSVQRIRYNCYLRLARKTGYMQLLFRVTTPVVTPFPAKLATFDGDPVPDIQDEAALRVAIGQVLQKETTKVMVLYMIKIK